MVSSRVRTLVTVEQRRVVDLYDKYGPAIFRRSLRLLRDRERAQDATHEIFLKLLREQPRETDPKSVLAWVYRTTTRHCLNVIRDAERHRRREERLAASEWDVVALPDADRLPQQRLAATVLTRFDEKTQAVAMAVLVDGMPHEEVAAALDISRKTVGRKLARFLDHARKYIARSES